MFLSSPDTGSRQERQIYDKALGKLKPNRTFGPTSATDTEREEREPSISGIFKVTDILAVGKEVNLALMLKNLTRDVKTVTVNMTAWTIVYNGTLVHEVWKDSVTITLDPEEGNSSDRLSWHHVPKVAGIPLGLEKEPYTNSVVKPWVLRF